MTGRAGLVDHVGAWPEVRFGPRRLGHVNMYVTDLQASLDFYHDVCGLELVFDEPGIHAKFLSNGNSHHDLAIMGVTDRDLRGRDGNVQVTAQRGAVAGLNHLAFEMATEADLVAAVARMDSAGLSVDRLSDHQISRSAYVLTPWQLMLELYADSHLDWRAAYARLEGELITERWDPFATGSPSREHRYVPELQHRPAAAGLARPLRTSSATVVVTDLDDALGYYCSVIGLHARELDRDEGRWAILAGADTNGGADLMLLEARGDQSEGFHHFTLELADVDELEATVERVADAGIDIARHVDHPLKRSIVLIDPDGVPVELAAYVAPRPHGAYLDVESSGAREFLI